MSWAREAPTTPIVISAPRSSGCCDFATPRSCRRHRSIVRQPWHSGYCRRRAVPAAGSARQCTACPNRPRSGPRRYSWPCSSSGKWDHPRLDDFFHELFGCLGILAVVFTLYVASSADLIFQPRVGPSRCRGHRHGAVIAERPSTWLRRCSGRRCQTSSSPAPRPVPPAASSAAACLAAASSAACLSAAFACSAAAASAAAFLFCSSCAARRPCPTRPRPRRNRSPPDRSPQHHRHTTCQINTIHNSKLQQITGSPSNWSLRRSALRHG